LPEHILKKFFLMINTFSALLLVFFFFFQQSKQTSYFFLGNNPSKEKKTLPLELKSNFYFPMKFRNFSIATILNFSTNAVLTPSKLVLGIFNILLEDFSTPKKATIFLNYMGFNIPVFFLMYDGKLEVIYQEKGVKEKIREKCDRNCNLININFEIFWVKRIEWRNFNWATPTRHFWL